MRSAQPSKYEPSMWTAVSGELIGRIICQFNSRGMVAMANNGSDQNKSQFFIAYSKQPHLDSSSILSKLEQTSSNHSSLTPAPVPPHHHHNFIAIYRQIYNFWKGHRRGR
ncbi:Peptidyl-prolyl cis-trans isomerase cyp10 [Serendipita sp. 405]|nr:Peptidyl-prolyl cis-trans isomerase cyp10 [Serendipita sp. 405]